MNWSLDYLNLLFVPLMLLTAQQVKQHWTEIWDSNFSDTDRNYLKKLVILLLMPAVVLVHELGHAVAVWLCGGKVAEFHFAFIWGYIVPQGLFSAQQTVWIYLAGNLVQIVIGMVCLLLALVVSSPPAVALLVYLGLWSIGGTIIFYALLSFFGLYGDWIAIYTSGTQPLITYIAIAHALLVVLILYLSFGRRPKIWFTKKTDPKWWQEYQLALTTVQQEPSPHNWISLGWLNFSAALYADALACIQKAYALHSHYTEAVLLESAIHFNRYQLSAATHGFEQVISDNKASKRQRIRAFIGLSECWSRRGNGKLAITTLDEGIRLLPQTADLHYYKALFLKAEGNTTEALLELKASLPLTWLNRQLTEAAASELEKMSSTKSQ